MCISANTWLICLFSKENTLGGGVGSLKLREEMPCLLTQKQKIMANLASAVNACICRGAPVESLCRENIADSSQKGPS